jgi:hypothetical protein
MFIGTQVITFDDKLFQVVRVFRERENFPITECKEYYRCDTTLKKDGSLYFCRLIPEVEILEESYNGEI